MTEKAIRTRICRIKTVILQTKYDERRAFTETIRDRMGRL